MQGKLICDNPAANGKGGGIRDAYVAKCSIKLLIAKSPDGKVSLSPLPRRLCEGYESRFQVAHPHTKGCILIQGPKSFVKGTVKSGCKHLH
jgi:hypothetical protein